MTSTRSARPRRNAARARREGRTGVSPEVVLGALVGALMHRALLERAPLTPAFVRQVVDLVASGVAPRAG